MAAKIDSKANEYSIEAYIIDPQGKSTLLLKSESKFNVDPFDPATAGKGYKEFFRKLEENDVCNLTLVFSPGTDKENSVSYKVPQGTACSIVYNENYVQEVYTDKECTKAYKFEKPETELTLYIK